jgi:hypothetical protein
MVKTLIKIFVLFIVFFTAGCSLQKPNSIDNNLQVVSEVKIIPTFWNYSIEKRSDSEKYDYNANSIIIDFKDNPKALTFRTILKEAVKNGPNFSRKYVITTWGCGTECQSLAVIDGNNGNVYFPEIGSELGIDFEIESTLLIVNPPDHIYSVYGPDVNKWPEWVNTRFYEWDRENNTFKLIKTAKIIYTIY